MTLFYRNIFTVLTGTGIAQLIPVLGSLSIVRIFSPDIFGEYALWFSLTIILTVIISGRFETCIAVKSPGEERNKAVYYTLITILIGTTFFIFLAIPIYLVFSEYIKLKQPIVLLLTPISAALTASIQLIISYYASEGLFKRLSIVRIIQSAAILILQVVAGLLFDNNVYALVLTHTFALFLTILFIFSLLKLRFNFNNFKPHCVIEFWKNNKKYLLYSLPADTINSVSAELPIIMVVAKFGSEAGGILALTLRVLGAPIGLIAKAVLDVFKKFASDEFREKGNCSAIFTKTFKILALLSLVFFTFSYFLIEDLFLIAFGSEWSTAGEAAKILLLLFSLRFIASPLSYVVYITENQEVDLYWQFLLLITTVSSFHFLSSLNGALYVYNIGYSMLYVLYLVLCYRMTKKQCTY